MNDLGFWEVGARDIDTARQDSLIKLWHLWREIDGDSQLETFLEGVNQGIVGGISGSTALTELCEELEEQGRPEHGELVTIFGIALGFFCDASRSVEPHKEQSQWNDLVESLYWTGYGQGGSEGSSMARESVRKSAQRAAGVRHAENRALKRR